MKSLGLVALVAGVWAATAVVSPGVVRALGGSFTFARVYDRIFEAGLVVALLVAWRALDLGDARAIGFAGPRRAAAFGRGVAIGVTSIVGALVLCWLGGALVPALRFAPLKTAWKAALGLLGATAIGVGEEALFRGVLLRRLSLDCGTPLGIALATAAYAVVHAIRVSGGGDAGPVTAWSGIERSAALLAPLARPGTLASVAGLAGLGLVLAAARLGSGTLWLPIGIHATWVAVFRVGRLFLDFRPSPWLLGPGWPPLVGGLAGWLAILVAGLLVARTPRAKARRD